MKYILQATDIILRTFAANVKFVGVALAFLRDKTHLIHTVGGFSKVLLFL